MPQLNSSFEEPLFSNQPGDRSSLHLNLAPLDDILKDPPTFHSFKGGSQQGTPITPLKPNPPLRVSPPHPSVSLYTPTVAQSPTLQQLLHTPTPTSTCSSKAFSTASKNNNNPPTPPPRWAKSSLSTPTSTITTTLTIPINQVNEVVLPMSENETPPTQEGHETAPQKDASNFLEGAYRHREQLDLHIRPSHVLSPQSTPCTPCNPPTPLSTPMSEEGGENRVKLRRSHKDRRRHSNHYHDVNIIDNAHFYRSSLADKISDYEDLWSSPPREVVSKDCPSPKKITRKMSTFKPNSDISKSLGDLSDISQNKTALFTCDDLNAEHNRLMNEFNANNSFDSIPSFRNTNSPFYVEPADCLREAENRARIKKSSSKILTRKIANRYSDSNIQWRSRQNRTSIMSRIESSGNASPFSSSVENLPSSYDTENDANICNSKYTRNKSSKNIQPRYLRGKPVAPPRVSSGTNLNESVDSNRPPWKVDSSWRYQPCAEDSKKDRSGHSGSPSGDAKFPITESSEELSGDMKPLEKTVIEMINEKLPNLPFADNESVSLSAITKVSEYDNVAIRCSNGVRHVDLNGSKNLKVTSPLGRRMSSSVSDSGTEFSEPWDSRKWDSLLQTDDETDEPISLSGTPARPQLEEWDRRLHSDGLLSPPTGESGAGSEEDSSSISGLPIPPLVTARHLDSTAKSKICKLLSSFFFFDSWKILNI